MTPSYHPALVNGRTGDPALFVETLHERRAFLFDLGDLSPLSARDLLRVDHVFVSHAHIDHLIGFDALLRVHVGRDKTIRMVGPDGFIQRIFHKLQGYSWDLVDRYATELVFEVEELQACGRIQGSRMCFSRAFAPEPLPVREAAGGVVVESPAFAVAAAVLDHHGPCLGFALQERAHANVWRNRLAERGLAPGKWLQALKLAVIEDRADTHPIAGPDGRIHPLAGLRDLVTITAGQKLVYVTDVADTPANRQAIAGLARNADLLFIEARFRAADAEQAARRAHLTTRAAGEIARAAGVRRVEAFHFSPRYADEAAMLAEVAASFAGAQAVCVGPAGPPEETPTTSGPSSAASLSTS